jgi:hypothetical protein
MDIVPLNIPAGLGLDRTSDARDVSGLRCLVCDNVDVLPGVDGAAQPGHRVRPRGLLRRWGQLILDITAVGEGVGTFTGVYRYAYVWTDGRGALHYSATSSTVNVTNNAAIRVSGWPVAPGSTVSIYRTETGPGADLKLVVADRAADADGGHYDDSTSDLGASRGNVPAHISPLSDRVMLDIATAVQAGAGFSGTYRYAYVWRDTNGQTHHSKISLAVVADDGGGGNCLAIRVSGWPANAGTTVDIYRTDTGPGVDLKLVVADRDATADNGHFDDSTAPPLGAVRDDVPAALPFDQSRLCDFLVSFRQMLASTVQRLIEASVRPAGPGTGGALYWNNPDLGEDFRIVWGADQPRSDQPYSFTVLNDQLWIAGAAQSGKALRRWNEYAAQPSKPSINSVGDEGAGNVSAATGHWWVIQRENISTGVRSLPSDPYNRAGPYSNRKFRVNFDAVSGTKTHVYRTSDGGQFFQYVATTQASSYDDNRADNDLSSETVPYEVGAAVDFQHVWSHKGLLWVGNKGGTAPQRSVVQVSSALFPYNFPVQAEYSFECGGDDGDEITGGCSWGEVCVVFKRRSVWLITGDPPTDFRVVRVPGSDGLGCVAARTIAVTPVGLVYLSLAGPCLMAEPGAAPQVIGQPINDVFVEPQRTAASFQVTPRLQFYLANTDIAAENYHAVVELATDPTFAVVDFTYDTQDAGDRTLFNAGGAPFPAGGVVLAPGQRQLVELTPPETDGPLAGTTYHVRVRSWDGVDLSDWVSLADFYRPAGAGVAEGVNWDAIAWAFGLLYPPRQEYWLFVPLGLRRWCDTCYVCDLAALREGGLSWRQMTVAATAGCVVDNLALGNLPPALYVLLAGPDGLLYLYPYPWAPADCDTRTPTLPIETSVTRPASPAAGVELEAAAATFPETGYGLRGTVIACRSTDGRIYAGYVRGNADDSLDVAWLGGRTPEPGTLEGVVGGLGVQLASGWLALGGADRSSIVRSLALLSAGETGRLYVGVRGAPAARRDEQGVVGQDRALLAGRNYGLARMSVDRRGHVHQVRVASVAPGAAWELSEIELTVQPGGRL